MNNERFFYRCEKCGNIVGIVESSGPLPACCGEDMKLLVAGSTDAALEKHVPVATRTGDKLHVQVGSVLHPMTPEHHIAWIAVAQGARTQRLELDPAGQPIGDFTIEDGPLRVYEYCNLHGLWQTDI